MKTNIEISNINKHFFHSLNDNEENNSKKYRTKIINPFFF